MTDNPTTQDVETAWAAYESSVDAVEALVPADLFSGQWYYNLVSAVTPPDTGNLLHVEPYDLMVFHSTGIMGTGWTAEFQALVPGDRIQASSGFTWVIQSVTETGGYFEIQVSPQVTKGETGDHLHVTFQRVTGPSGVAAVSSTALFDAAEVTRHSWHDVLDAEGAWGETR